MSSFTVIYDACVLYPAPLRNLLMHLALAALVNARWSDDIHEEWIRNLLEKRPDLTRAQLENIKALMDAHVRDAKVEGYRDLIDTLPDIPDANDVHVFAAAIKSKWDYPKGGL